MKTNSVTKQTISLFWRHAWRYKYLVILLFSGVAAAVITLNFIAPYIAAQVLGKISHHNYDPNNLWGSFGGYILLYFFTTFISAFALWRVNVWIVWELELKVTRDLAKKSFEHLMDMSAGFHSNRFSGSLVSQANKLTGAYVRFTDATVFSLFTLLIALVATAVILTPRAPLYTAVLLTLAVIYLAGAFHFSKPVRKANSEEASAESTQTGALADSITNVLAVKSFARADFEKVRFWKIASFTREKGLVSRHTTMVRETYSSILTSTLSVSSLLVAIIGVYLFNSDITTLFLIVTYTAGVGERLWEFQNVLRQYNRAFGDASDMVEILQIEPEIKDPPAPEKIRIKNGDISFENMTFAHAENREPLFKDMNLEIKAGEKVGLVGHSGGGKTTLTKLLLRFSDIDSGSIKIDGQDIRNVKQDSLRERIAYVPQEPLLFHRSLSENISYGKPSATQKEIEMAAKLAHAHEFIEQLEHGYETLVGERGVKLSGGQRQRIAIARALLKDAPILVLDEATSALDSESEKLIQDALWKLMEGRTAIVIAHRLSTIQRMDRIVVLEEGKIIEEGSHKELLAEDGTYAKLWSHQSGGFIEE